MTTSLPHIARIVSVLCWMTVAVVLLRMVSGGGSVAGIGYVLATEPRLAILTGALVLTTAAIVAVALVQRRPWAWRASWIGAAAALVGSLLLVVDDHASGLLAAAAAGLALAIGVVMSTRRVDAG